MSVVLYARMHNIILRLVCVYIQEVYYMHILCILREEYVYLLLYYICILYELIILCILRA